MHILMLTRRVDQADWLAGFTHTWIDRLARQVNFVNVICLELGDYDLPANVRVQSMGKERGYSRPHELWEFRRAIRPIIRDVDVIFGHMIPRYTLIAAPWAIAHRIPIVQWYTHRQVTVELRLVHTLAKHIVTASPESFTLPSDKLTVLGHGIDMERFAPASEKATGERLVLAVGRLSPIKNYEVLIKAFGRLAARPGCEDVRVAIAGGLTPNHGQTYADQLHTLVGECGVGDRVNFLGPIPYREIHHLYQQAAVTINLCPTGGADKAVLESMAAGVPALVHNQTFLPLLAEDAPSLWCETLDPDQIADRLAVILSQPPEQRQELGLRLRERVRADYDLDGLIRRLVRIFEEAMQ
jgi:glycosyltransferase involved in cell wall biosynthesis